MEAIYDAAALIKYSREQLNEIEIMYQDALELDEIPNPLKIKIKNCLENLRSSLDFIGNYLFDTYCAGNYGKIELERIKKRIYFPIRKSEDEFKKLIAENFIGLKEQLAIYEIIEKCQPYNSANGVSWLKLLNDLTIKNKHLQFTHQRRTESAQINYMKDFNGIVFKNCSIEGSGHAIMINGSPFYGENNAVKKFDGVIKRVDYFIDIDKPVIEVLNEIHNELSKTIYGLIESI